MNTKSSLSKRLKMRARTARLQLLNLPFYLIGHVDRLIGEALRQAAD